MSSEPISPSAPTPDAAPRPSSSEPARPGMPILRLAWPFALLAVAAVLLGRAIGPAVPGIGVGMDRIIPAIELAGKIVSQLFAIAAIVFAMAEILAAARGRLPSFLRLAALGLGGVVVLVSFLASPRRELLPPAMVGFSVLAAAVLALLAAGSAWSARYARAAAIVVGLIGLSGIIRLFAVALAYKAAEPRWEGLLIAARSVSTVSFLCEGAATFAATAWVASRARKLTSPATLIVFGLAFLLTRQALQADLDDASPLSLLIRRSAERLLTRPEPLLPNGIVLYLALLTPLVALGALLVRDAPPPPMDPRQPPVAASPSTPAIRAALALALLVRGAPEMPLNALLLVIASLTLALAARDDRAVWAALDQERARTRASTPRATS